MRVVYELECTDIKKILAEKYGVKEEKVDIYNGTFARIDMSETETPEEHPKRQINTKCDFSEPEPSEDKKANIPVIDGQDPEERFNKLTDEQIQAYLESGGTVVQLCKDLGFDTRIKFRLYKRAEKFRSEGASHAKRRRDTKKP